MDFLWTKCSEINGNMLMGEVKIMQKTEEKLNKNGNRIGMAPGVVERFQAIAKSKHDEKVEGNKRQHSKYRPPAYTNPILLAYRAAAYFYRQDQADQPYTEAGLQIATLLDKDTIRPYLQGDRDYLATDTVESKEGNHVDKLISDYRVKEEIQPYYQYIIGLDPNEDNTALLHQTEYDQEGNTALLFSEILKKAKALIGEQREQRLCKRGSVADIFALKAREGWQDNTETVHRIEIAQEEKQERLEELGYKLIK